MVSVKPRGMRFVGSPVLNRFRGAIILIAMAGSLAACAVAPSPDESAAAPIAAPTLPVKAQQLPNFAQTGLASWYARSAKFKRTASGEQLADNQLTAAHRTLPLGTIVHVTNLRTGASVDVRINDRGPFVAGRVIDLSYDAARRLGMMDNGVVPVRLEVFNPPDVKVGKNTIAVK